MFSFFFFQAEDGIRDLVRSRGLGDVYKRQNLKRARARYGLEVLNKLSDLKSLSLITKNLEKSELEVDQQLLNLAKTLKAQLFTVDFNLAQRAKIEGVKILSPAELAEALKLSLIHI